MNLAKYTSNKMKIGQLYFAVSPVDCQEMGYGSGDESCSVKSDKENSNPNRNGVIENIDQRGRAFAKPKVSKLRQPEDYSQSNSRKGSKSRSGSRRRLEMRN